MVEATSLTPVGSVESYILFLALVRDGYGNRRSERCNGERTPPITGDSEDGAADQEAKDAGSLWKKQQMDGFCASLPGPSQQITTNGP